eukprot:2246082-Prymnesium_polylepis.1
MRARGAPLSDRPVEPPHLCREPLPAREALPRPQDALLRRRAVPLLHRHRGRRQRRGTALRAPPPRARALTPRVVRRRRA